MRSARKIRTSTEQRQGGKKKLSDHEQEGKIVRVAKAKEERENRSDVIDQSVGRRNTWKKGERREEGMSRKIYSV